MAHPSPDAQQGIPRRRLLQWVAAAVGAAGFGGIAAACRGIVVDSVDQLARDYPEAATEVALESPPTPTSRPTEVPPSARVLGIETDIRLTPNSEFYTLKYGDLPDHADADAWRLEVGGLVESAISFSLADLEALPRQKVMRTLECISNPAGGQLIGNAVWEGVRLVDVLALAKPLAAATDLKLEAADRYHTGVSLEIATDPDSLLVFRMNGQELPHEHGRPVRCLFPGRYGQKQPKWITKITLVDQPWTGHWEGQGWSHEAPIKVNSRIDVPANGATVMPPATVAGIAFSGVDGVTEVAVIVDDKPVGTATLKKAPEPYANLVWTEWSWTGPAAPGNHTAMSKARDGAGITQRRPREALLEGTKPDGTSDMHKIRWFLADQS